MHPIVDDALVVDRHLIRIERPEDAGAAWGEALAADRPVVFAAVTVPGVPPLPPHSGLGPVETLPKDPAKGRIARQSVRGELDQALYR